MIVDIVIIAIMVLVALIGLWKGFYKSLVGFLAFGTAFLAAFFLSGLIAYALVGVESINNFLFGGVLFEFSRHLAGGFAGTEGIIYNLIAPFASSIAGNSLVAGGYVSTHDANVALVIFALFTSVVGIVLFGIIRLLLIPITFLLKRAMATTKDGKRRRPKAASRIFGFLFSGGKGLIYAMAIFVFIGFATPFIAPVANQIDSGFMASPILNATATIQSRLVGNPSNVLDRILPTVHRNFDPYTPETPGGDTSQDPVVENHGVGEALEALLATEFANPSYAISELISKGFIVYIDAEGLDEEIAATLFNVADWLPIALESDGLIINAVRFSHAPETWGALDADYIITVEELQLAFAPNDLPEGEFDETYKFLKDMLASALVYSAQDGITMGYHIVRHHGAIAWAVRGQGPLSIMVGGGSPSPSPEKPSCECTSDGGSCSDCDYFLGGECVCLDDTNVENGNTNGGNDDGGGYPPVSGDEPPVNGDDSDNGGDLPPVNGGDEDNGAGDDNDDGTGDNGLGDDS